MKYHCKRRLLEKNKKMPNFQDLFSLEDIKVAVDVQKTYPCTLSRIALCAPDQHYILGSSISDDSGSVIFDAVTLKLKYAIEVWCRVALMMDKNPSPDLYYWWLGFKDNETAFRHIEYHNFYYDMNEEKLLARFWELLEHTANTGKIWVKEGYSFRDKKPGDYLLKPPSITCDVVVDADDVREGLDKVIGYIRSVETSVYRPSPEPKTYRWEEIKDLFRELTLDQLRLTLPRFMHKCTELDEALMHACMKGDLEAVKFCIRKGANVNAINKYGNTPLYYAISDNYAMFVQLNKEYTKEEKSALEATGRSVSREIVECLLESGADIDLYGYDGMQPLLAAYYSSDVDMVRMLLERGANPNYHSYITDGYWNVEQGISSTALYCIYDEVEPLTPEQIEMEKLLYAYGGRIYKWGFNPRSYGFEDKCLIWMEPHRTISMFTDADGIEVGDSNSLTIEKGNGETIKIDLSDIADVLSDWEKEYRESFDDRTVDRRDLYDLGREIARKEILPRLPDWVNLYYQREETPVIEAYDDL